MNTNTATERIQFSGFDGKTYNGLRVGTRKGLTTIVYTVYLRDGRKLIATTYLTKRQVQERITRIG